MLVEQIVEFELSEPEPPWSDMYSGTPITSYFHDKTKISKEYFRMDYFIIYC